MSDLNTDAQQGPAVSTSGLPATSPALTADVVTEFYKQFGIAPHPILRLPPTEKVLTQLKDPNGRASIVDFFKRRQQRIGLADTDPINWGFEAETWADADAILKGCYKCEEDYREAIDCLILAIFGGNRAQKTWYALKRAMQCATIFPGGLIVILSESETASIATVQKLAWFYLKPLFGHLNNKRDAVFKINYSQANGFSDRKAVLPNGTEIYFLTYGQDPGDYEGWEFGAPLPVYERIAAQRMAAGEFVPPNVGAVADESMRLSWLKMFSRRLKFRQSKLLWSFTPVKGITPAIKEVVGTSAVTIEARPSELLKRENIPGIKAGHMPYIQKCVFQRAYAIYFFTLYNKFGPSAERTYYQEVKELCEGKTTEYIERVAYGYARDSMARAFKNFGAWNIVKRKHLPAIGTNYMFTDPAGARNWATFWVRVVPGNPPSVYIYRDWPDEPTWGEWAVATEREVNEEARKGWDGDPGPAQYGFSGGTTKYKQLWLEVESLAKDAKDAKAGMANGKWQMAKTEMDPYRVRLIEMALANGSDLNELREEIAERYVDPRAGRSEHHAEHGGTCIIDEFAEENRDSKGQLVAPSMDLIPASGVRIEEGEFQLNELLDWNQEQPLMPVLNQPHLYVCEDCHQVRWMFENYTGRGGEKGGCKDFADLARYMAMAKIEHIDARAARGKVGGGF
jgi:hypothetical protein